MQENKRDYSHLSEDRWPFLGGDLFSQLTSAPLEARVIRLNDSQRSAQVTISHNIAFGGRIESVCGPLVETTVIRALFTHSRTALALSGRVDVAAICAECRKRAATREVPKETLHRSCLDPWGSPAATCPCFDLRMPPEICLPGSQEADGEIGCSDKACQLASEMVVSEGA
ncbi:hypothetical protein QR680_009698 [Steinernema hermaphroditum]|uniref:Uncharacterized protein n=1 Tax=Steinernema hermaphroditum TaxID=289476 RepID=A0AA39IN23_9BILA|nr:hypothetical protein QR680_009698 [Steinernema hermaphroditum]